MGTATDRMRKTRDVREMRFMDGPSRLASLPRRAAARPYGSVTTREFCTSMGRGDGTSRNDAPVLEEVPVRQCRWNSDPKNLPTCLKTFGRGDDAGFGASRAVD